MRLPFPERIPLFFAFIFAAVLCGAQMLEGTPAAFSICSYLFIIVAAIAFNVAGGFTRPSGSYIFFYAVLGVVIGLFWKAVLGEAANSNLEAPQLTIEVYLGGICGMLVAAYISRKFSTRRALLGTLLEESRMQNATIGCTVVGILIVVLDLLVPHQNGSFLSAIEQVDRFLPLAIIIGVTYQIRKSGGTRSINLPVLLAFAFSFFSGVVSFSKEGMLTPFLCWIAAACSMRYRVSLLQMIGGVFVAIFIFVYLVPFSQYGRNYKTTSFSKQFDVAVDLLGRPDYVREQYEMQRADEYQEEGPRYFDTAQGFFDRLQMISMDDSLIAYTEQRGAFGYLPIIQSFGNLVPHVFWPNKPLVTTGNFYAHEIGGILNDDDTTTGISFTPTGEAFHLARWTGVLILAPALWIVLFIIFDSLCGDVRKSPWGLVIAIVFSHVAPEGMLSGVIYMYFYTSIMIVIAALSVSYIMPSLGSLFAGPEGIQIIRRGPVRSFPRRLPGSPP